MDFQILKITFLTPRRFKSLILSVNIFCILSAVSGCGYLESRNLKMALDQKNCLEAKNILLKSLKNNLNNDYADYNLIFAFVCSGDLNSANKQIDAILTDNSKYKYELYFLKGYILGEMGDIDEALMAYQMALDINADIKIKQNMELLLKEQQSGKSGKKKKGKSKKQDESDPNGDKKEDENDQDQKKDPKDSSGDKKKKDEKKQSKKMTAKQIEKIMKEIDGDEKKIRSQGLKVKSKKGGQNNEKNW